MACRSTTSTATSTARSSPGARTPGLPGPVATFEMSRIPAGLRSGELTVRVRLCPYVGAAPSTERCGDYGPDGGTSLRLADAPLAFQVDSASTTEVYLSWNAVADATMYGFELRKQGAAAWTGVQDSVTSTAARITARIYNLECRTAYELVVRAHGDGVTYDDDWGFWSDVVSATTAACPVGGASGQSGGRGLDGARWRERAPALAGGVPRRSLPGGDTGSRLSRHRGRRRDRAPCSHLAPDQGCEESRRSGCGAASRRAPGLCGLHHEMSLLPPVPAPRGLTATPSGADGVALSWGLVSGADRYRVEHSTSTAGDLERR